MGLNTVFVSYPSEDGIIAQQVSNAIQELEGNKFKVFLDRNYIGGGERITPSIEEALRDTLYFVAIATDVTRKNFDYCGQELGFYRGSHPADTRRETCLYHAAIPHLFEDLRNFKAQSIRPEHQTEFGRPVHDVDKTEFYDFLKDVAKLHDENHPNDDPDNYWVKVRGWAKKWTEIITETYFVALQSRVKDEWYPQGRLELTVSQGDFYKAKNPAIPPDSEVNMSGTTYNIFLSAIPGMPRPVSWSSFVEFVTVQTGSNIFCKIVEDIIVSALPSRANAKNDYVFQAPDRRFYRVLLVRHNVYGNKRRDIVLNLIETLEKVSSGDEVTTELIAGINLGSKYRSIFIEPNAKYRPEKLEGLTLDETVTKVDQMMHDIARINADAASDGLADYDNLIILLGETAEIKELFTAWYAVFPPMEAAAKTLVEHPNEDARRAFLDAYGPFIEMSRKNNKRFLELCMDAYRRAL